MRADIKMYRSALKNAIILLDPAPADFAGAARVETRPVASLTCRVSTV
jgi:hypothetical protein